MFSVSIASDPLVAFHDFMQNTDYSTSIAPCGSTSLLHSEPNHCRNADYVPEMQSRVSPLFRDKRRESSSVIDNLASSFENYSFDQNQVLLLSSGSYLLTSS
ncbi:hypothetical protein POM88_026946 [Heracleum sosnowskyi]|uniref:Uncharacterized protein n=1 Tax=Heracleum sosnowskyi TaxID=360622 RepID=A0AAD8I932_9APIA|nr:hypothetical protein POM88_026946 [Heracleum sosnowskyi]